MMTDALISPVSRTQARPLGRSGLSTRPLALGGNAIGWTADQATSHAVIDRFVDAGYSLIDTADVYSKWVPGHTGGESETIIGNWIKTRGNRDRLLVATKVGGEMGPGRGGLSTRHLRSAVEESLRRLQTDYIDLYQAHYDDPLVPLEETLGTFNDLIAEGKVRAIGFTNYSIDRMEAVLEASKAHGLPCYSTYQPLYNLYDRQQFEQEIAPVCRREGLGVINFYSLASGFLTGKYRSAQDVEASRRQKSNQRYLNERGIRILAGLDDASRRLGVKQAQVALAWLVAQPDVTAPIASATSIDQVDELIAAAQLDVGDDIMGLLNSASAYG